jgi:hypothetical protein
VIRIGPAGWSYKDWAGIVYPNPLPKGFSQVEFLSKLFDTIEINTSFYGPPNPHMTRRWAEQVWKPEILFFKRYFHNGNYFTPVHTACRCSCVCTPINDATVKSYKRRERR